jgi:hypothetical protein
VKTLCLLRAICSALGVFTAPAAYAKLDVTFVAVKSPISNRSHPRAGSSEFELVLTYPKFQGT